MFKDMDELSARLSLADMSSAIAYGLQRAIDLHQANNPDFYKDKILRYGGRLNINIEIIPSQLNAGLPGEVGGFSE